MESRYLRVIATPEVKFQVHLSAFMTSMNYTINNAKTREQCNVRAAQCFSKVSYEILTKYASCLKVHWDIHFSPPLICIVELIILLGVVYASRSPFWGLPPPLTPLCGGHYDRLMRKDRLATKPHAS